ncbi:hypothetical protein GGR50DRAFT_673885 [Xylaria sp. CBS 124048]|nr:hypothetical protein GGR50DRAFT_673885 [Xylaria sp. CBS 124048]
MSYLGIILILRTSVQTKPPSMNSTRTTTTYQLHYRYRRYTTVYPCMSSKILPFHIYTVPHQTFSIHTPSSTFS